MHKVVLRVYYEDTDAGGVVYYANYLKFAERARTEMLRTLGIKQSELIQTHGMFFVVRYATLDLLKPARLDDEITVGTVVTQCRGASIVMEQKIYNSDIVLAQITVKIGCVNTDFVPMRLPEEIKKLLG